MCFDRLCRTWISGAYCPFRKKNVMNLQWEFQEASVLPTSRQHRPRCLHTPGFLHLRSYWERVWNFPKNSRVGDMQQAQRPAIPSGDGWPSERSWSLLYFGGTSPAFAAAGVRIHTSVAFYKNAVCIDKWKHSVHIFLLSLPLSLSLSLSLSVSLSPLSLSLTRALCGSNNVPICSLQRWSMSAIISPFEFLSFISFLTIVGIFPFFLLEEKYTFLQKMSFLFSSTHSFQDNLLQRLKNPEIKGGFFFSSKEREGTLHSFSEWTFVILQARVNRL